MGSSGINASSMRGAARTMVEEQTSPTILDSFYNVGRGGCLAAGGERHQIVDWNSMPRDKRSPEDCARLCLTDGENILNGFFGFDTGYGRCRCFYAAGSNPAYPVRLNTNGGYDCFAFDLPGLCEDGLPPGFLQ